MKTYEISATVSLMCTTNVEAENEESARKEAMGLLENSRNYESDCLNITVSEAEIEDVNEY